MPTTVRVWDPPTRVFHWALAGCVLGSLGTAWIPGAPIEWHARLGYAILALLAFRLLWGLVGGHWSRFRSFLYSPGSTVAYLRGRPYPDPLVGRNPLGALSVFAMLLVLAAQVGTGLASDDDAGFTGPWNRHVSSAKVLAATWYHGAIGQWLVVALVGLHVGAIVFYAVRRHANRVGPMLRGDKEVAHGAVSSADRGLHRVLALALFAACAGAVWWAVR